MDAISQQMFRRLFRDWGWTATILPAKGWRG